MPVPPEPGPAGPAPPPPASPGPPAALTTLTPQLITAPASKTLLLVALSSRRNAGTVKVAKGGTFTLANVRAGCPAGSRGPCPITVTATARPATRAAKSKSAKPVNLGTLGFTVPAGKTRSVRGKLSRKGRSLLAKRKRIAATVSITAKVPGGGTVTRSVLTTLKPSRR